MEWDHRPVAEEDERAARSSAYLYTPAQCFRAAVAIGVVGLLLFNAIGLARIDNGEMDIGARAELLRVQAAHVAVAVEHAAQSHALPCGAVPAERQIPRVLASMKVTNSATSGTSA